MIGFTPPLVLPFIPPSQKLARAYFLLIRDEGQDLTRATLMLLDEAGDRISPDTKSMPNAGKIPQAGVNAISTGTEGLAGDTNDRCESRNYVGLLRATLGIGPTVGVVL